MTGTDLVQQTLQLLDHPQYLEQIEGLLPEDVPLRRFMQVAKTAIRSNPDLVDAKIDQNTLFAAIIRCAQDGLYPDNHEAALVPYKGKVSYLPMVSGVVRAARDYGWLMHAEAVYENDEFEWRSSDEKPLHRHPRPGVARGDLVAAYAYATQRGETMAVVLYADDIDKRRKKAQTDNVWKEWPEAMWRKSAAHALYRKLPRSERDRTDRFDDTAVEPAVAAELLYGPDGATFLARPAPGPPADQPSDVSEDGGAHQQAIAPATPSGAVAPGDDEPEPSLELNGDQESELRAAAEVVASTEIPVGAYKGMTLEQVKDAGDAGATWLWWALRNASKFDDDFNAALETFVQGSMPELQARYDEWRNQRQAA